MDRFELIKNLMAKVESYAESTTDKDELSMEEFVQHLQSQKPLSAFKNTFIKTREYPESEKVHHREENIERIISQQLLYLYRYIKFYSKQVFVNNKVKSIEEFGIIMTVMQQVEISKSELIKRNILDKSSGIEIINRLVKNQLLTQTDNPNDQRSQLISLSPLGRMQVFQLFEKMETLGNIATGEISESEKFQLAAILKKLDHFHFENYTNKNLKELEDYLPESMK